MNADFRELPTTMASGRELWPSGPLWPVPKVPVAVAALLLEFTAWMGQRRGQSPQPTYSVLQVAHGTFQLWPLPFQEVA